MKPPLEGAGIRRVVVFRALMLGDMLCAVPALRALRAGFPAAHIALVGLPWAHALALRLAYVDEFIEFPGHPRLPERRCDASAWRAFLAGMRARGDDLAVQLHGSGMLTNRWVAAFGARRCAGFAAPRAWRPVRDDDLFVAWPERGHEIGRLLALTDRLGLPRCGLHLEFPLTEADREAARRLLREAAPAGARGPSPHVCLHVGAQLPSRRWDPRRFAQVADALAARGLSIVLTGVAAEAALVAQVAACMRHRPLNLCGRTSLWTLGALVEAAEAVICNDTGISHVAAALRRPSVVVSCGSDPERWAPLDRALHRVIAHPVPCRPCSDAVCPHGHECAAAVRAGHVLRRLRAGRGRSADARAGMPDAGERPDPIGARP
ncbi:MAG: glycosyltransferase family 9 protein [Burkholderiaceae bacterium]|nr:glycosyltransferase family 9 protein [Burkholderiaceae bacterium]